MSGFAIPSDACIDCANIEIKRLRAAIEHHESTCAANDGIADCDWGKAHMVQGRYADARVKVAAACIEEKDAEIKRLRAALDKAAEDFRDIKFYVAQCAAFDGKSTMSMALVESMRRCWMALGKWNPDGSGIGNTKEGQ